MDFGDFICPYNILTCIQQRLKGEDTLSEVVKHKKDLASLNMSEDEVKKVYTLSIADPGLFGGKCSTKSDIGPLPDYAMCCNKSLQISLGNNIENMLDPVHWDINTIVMIQYQYYPPIRALATEMALQAIEFIFALGRWIDDTY